MRPENVYGYLLKIISQYPENLKHGAILIITEGRIRMRHLPLDPVNVGKVDT